LEIKDFSNKIKSVISRYKFAFIVLLVGLVLLLLPERNQRSTPIEYETVPTEQTISIEALSEILQTVDGAGEVRVLLSVANGEETIYQTNQDNRSTADENSTKIETVIVSDSSRKESGLVTQKNPPTYMGAIVVCQGADNPSVKFAIAQAVAKITGLGMDEICVLKMK